MNHIIIIITKHLPSRLDLRDVTLSEIRPHTLLLTEHKCLIVKLINKFLNIPNYKIIIFLKTIIGMGWHYD